MLTTNGSSTQASRVIVTMPGVRPNSRATGSVVTMVTAGDSSSKIVTVALLVTPSRYAASPTKLSTTVSLHSKIESSNGVTAKLVAFVPAGITTEFVNAT